MNLTNIKKLYLSIIRNNILGNTNFNDTGVDDLSALNYNYVTELSLGIIKLLI